MNLPAFTNGRQQGVIAEDRFPNRAGAKEETPSSKKTPGSKVVTPLQGYVSYVTFTRGDAPGYRIMHLRCAGPCGDPSLTARPQNRNRPYLFNSERLQPVLIYHQFVCAAAMSFANVIPIPAFTTGGQQGVIAEDRRLRRSGAKEGTPSSKSS